jgi:polysaccharide deacetylase 2 family uncharacterized protein YibQ
MGLPVAKRSVFLDNDLTPGAIKRQIGRLLSIARQSGQAIGIAHPHKETADVLKEIIPQLKKEFDVVYVSELTG